MSHPFNVLEILGDDSNPYTTQKRAAQSYCNGGLTIVPSFIFSLTPPSFLIFQQFFFLEISSTGIIYTSLRICRSGADLDRS